MSSVVEIQSFYEFLVVKHDTLSIEELTIICFLHLVTKHLGVVPQLTELGQEALVTSC